MSSIKYRPEVDGLRTIAVIPVVLFHLGFGWIGGGFLGVDVFFVISGYLITSILMKENSINDFSYIKFWTRRIRRILPALLIMIILTLIASYFIIFKPNLILYAKDALGAAFSYANIQMWMKFGDYWGQAAEKSPFLHAWSLSVEEQFYILYPGFIAILAKYKIQPFKWLFAIAIGSYILFLYSAAAHPNFGFFLLPTRAWELACGGLLALKPGYNLPSRFFKAQKVLPTIGMLLILISYFLVSNGIGFVATLPVVGAVLIIGFSSPDEFIGRLLGNRMFVFIGKVSYSLYLWHWPIIVLSKAYPHRTAYSPAIYLVIISALILVTTLISYYLVEKPTRKMKHVVKLVGVLIIVLGAVVSVYLFQLVDLNYRSKFETTKFYGNYFDVSPKASGGGALKRYGIFVPYRDSKFETAYYNEGIVRGNAPGYPNIIVMGDSHGAMWAKVIEEIGAELKIKQSFYTTVGHNPLFYFPEKAQNKTDGFTKDQWKKYTHGFVRNFNAWRPKIFIVACKWTSRTKDDFAKLESLIELAAANKTTVVLFNQPPIMDEIGDNNCTQYLSFLGFAPNGKRQYIPLIDNSIVYQKNKELYALSKKHLNSVVLDINKQYKVDNTGLIVNDKSVMYYDDDHLSYQGTLVAKDVIKKQLLDLLKKRQ